MEQLRELVLPALELRQGLERKLYSFAVDGKLLSRFTTISRIHQTNGHDIAGYQRPEVLSHIAEIRGYLESKNPMLPTNIVVAFDETVTFVPAPNITLMNGAACPGMLRIPLNDNVNGHRKPGWIVDGQQRVAAIREAKMSTSSSSCASGTAFSTSPIAAASLPVIRSPDDAKRGEIY